LPLIRVDGILLEQVFVNLLENAARYCPLGSTVEIAATTEDQSLLVSVSDNGPGLTPGTEEKVFAKFYRGVSPPDARRGSGLGLAICRAVIRLHGGAITASNRPVGGAQFLIRLPIPREAPRIAQEPQHGELHCSAARV
jgi:two-component system sensor histidine kinase KdpD